MYTFVVYLFRKMSKVLYTGVFLDEQSREILAREFKNFIPDEGWVWVAHHMTIAFGKALPDDMREKYLGKKVELTVNSFGMDDNAMAVGVTGFESANDRPHITLAFNKSSGGKPVMSNYISSDKWKACAIDQKLTGIITEELADDKKKPLTEGFDVKKLQFYNDIIQSGGKIYQVGGAVRDLYLGKQSKDLDIVISGIPADKLQALLGKYGKVDMVGASFGIIKFTPPGGEEIDIAIPRTEKKSGTGYQGFDVDADHTLPIEKDLERRDFTINSIAKDSEGNIIDPFNGVKDLDAKVIRLTNPKAFADDPLRMLRAIQFASRFEFTIDQDTFDMIKKNAHTIEEISKERVLIEFEKIISKGKPRIGAQLLVESGLYQGIFGVDYHDGFEPFDYVTKMSEFVYWLIEPFTDMPDTYFKVGMKGDEKSTKEIAALAYLYDNNPGNDIIKQRWVFNRVVKIAPSMVSSKFVKSLLHDVYPDFMSHKYPASLIGVAVNGNDLMQLGLKGEAIGKAFNEILNAIYSDQIENNKGEIIKFISQQKNTINESIQPMKKVVFYDFDGTIMDSPLPDVGKPHYEKTTGEKFPHVGWWSKPESLDLSIFDIQPHSDVAERFRKDKADPNTYVVLLTNRLFKLEKEIKKILDKHDMHFDEYSFKNDGRDKGERVLDIMKTKFPDVKNLEFYDDDPKHIQDVHSNLIDTEFEYQVYKIVDGAIA